MCGMTVNFEDLGFDFEDAPEDVTVTPNEDGTHTLTGSREDLETVCASCAAGDEELYRELAALIQDDEDARQPA